jgi:hypothetical protein
MVLLWRRPLRHAGSIEHLSPRPASRHGGDGINPELPTRDCLFPLWLAATDRPNERTGGGLVGCGCGGDQGETARDPGMVWQAGMDGARAGRRRGSTTTVAALQVTVADACKQAGSIGR